MPTEPGTVLEVNDATFETEVLGASGVVMVDFWAAWCGPCRMIGPIVEQLAAEYAGRARVVKLDVDANPRTAARYNVRSLPSVLLFKDGHHVDTVVGAVPRPVLQRRLQEHL